MARKPVSIVELFSISQPYANEFRRLLHRMRKQREGAETKAVMITSAMLSEGKSTIASFLSLTAARQKDMNTLLIDADLRRPSVHKFFSLERAPGLANVLRDGIKPTDVVKKTPLDRLHIMTAGSVGEHPADIFDAESIGNVVDELKFYYDLIVIDTAPILPVSDPMLLAPKVDGVLLVVKAGATQREIVSRAVELLDVNRKHIIGVILNNMNNSLPYYYDYRYYGYEYEPDRPGERPVNGKRTGRKRGKTAARPPKGEQDRQVKES
jgi:capsular exopolysaccharide synthesis family protein